MDNKRDEMGWPICPVCSTSVRPGQGAIRPDDYVVHQIPCWDHVKYGDQPVPWGVDAEEDSL